MEHTTNMVMTIAFTGAEGESVKRMVSSRTKRDDVGGLLCVNKIMESS